jgi:hypothetical protein
VNVRAIELDAGSQEIDEGKFALFNSDLWLLDAIAIARVSRSLDSCGAFFGFRGHGADSLIEYNWA